MNSQSKTLSPVPSRIQIDEYVEEIEIDLCIERVIQFVGIVKNGKKVKYFLKVTRKGRLTLT